MSLSVLLFLLGQTLAVFDYPLAANLGLQEDLRLVGEFGVQLNRAFGASDTLVYIPFMICPIIDLCLKKRWALFTSAAVMGISLY